MLFDDRDNGDTQEVRISSGKQEESSKLREEAEESLGENASEPSSGPSVSDLQSSGEVSLETIQRQNKEMIEILEEIRDEVTGTEETSSTSPDGGAPADQLL